MMLNFQPQFRFGNSVDVISSHLFPPLLVKKVQSSARTCQGCRVLRSSAERSVRFVILGREVQGILQIYAAY